MSHSAETLQAALHEDVGNVSGILLPLCLNSVGYPLGGPHLAYLNELDLPAIAPEVIASLSLPYIYLAGAFFCVDHVFDNESKNSEEILAPGLLVALALRRLAQVESKLNSGYAADWAVKLFLEFTGAMREERLQAQAKSQKNCFNHIVGRSALFVFGYRLLCAVKSIAIDEKKENLLKQVVYFLQHGDDIGDWRQDYLHGKITPTLAAALERIGSDKASEIELERFMYFSGFYEERCAMVASGLNQICDQIDAGFGIGGAAVRAFVEKQANRIKKVAQRFEHVKAGGAFYEIYNEVS